MTTTTTVITYAEYNKYRQAFITDGMVPLKYIDWIRVQRQAIKEGL